MGRVRGKDGKGDKGGRTRTGGITERLPCLHNRGGMAVWRRWYCNVDGAATDQSRAGY